MPQYSIRCRGRLVPLHTPLVMGILNITPDSFWSGSRTSLQEVVDRAGALLEAGAACIDLGGQSTRPGSEAIGAAAEADRVLPAVAAVHQAFRDALISIDTYHASVARAAVAGGACLINDVSGGTLDPEMWAEVVRLKVPYVLSHIQGRPGTMQEFPRYGNVVQEVFDRLNQDFHRLRSMGAEDIILDPGFGFGKGIGHNLELLSHLSYFRLLPAPLMVGLSRKATIYRTLGISAAEALNGSTVMHTLALAGGACILRVHDVKEATEAVRLMEAVKQRGNAALPLFGNQCHF